MTLHATARTCAVIEIGRTSTHVLVAHCAPDELSMVTEATTMHPLGEKIRATSAIAPETQEAILATVRQHLALAQRHHADPLLIVATEPLRQTKRSQTLLESLERGIGQHVTVLSEAMEAALKYHGAASGPAIPPDAGVLEVGDDRSQLVIAQQHQITWLISLPIGSGWLHHQYLISNPPSPDEVTRVEGLLQTYLSGIHLPQPPPALLVTGVIAQTLFTMAKQVLKLSAHEDRLTREDLLGCRGVLLALSAEAIARHYRQSMECALLLPGGAMLMLAMMGFLHLDEIRVRTAGVCEGVLLAYARSGERWLDDPALTLAEPQIGQAPLLPHEDRQAAAHQEAFAQSGRKELPKRAETFLGWRDAVLTNEDIEAVHKMRVASRRLRATLDAYQPACQTKPFKQTYRTVKNAADRLGAARDTDVMLQHIEGLLAGAPNEDQAGMHWLLERLKSYRQECQHELESFLSSLDEHAFQEAIATCLPKAASSKGKTRPLPELDPQAPTGQHASRIAHLKLEELYRWSDAVDQPYAVRELHRLRIAAKRLRYTLEVFAPFLPDGCKSVVKALEHVQEELGQLHDSDVLIALLRLCLGGLEHPLAPQARSEEETKRARLRPFLPTALVQHLINPEADCSAEQRYGLEQLVRQQQRLREDVYRTFRQHWYHLQEQDLRRHLLALLESGSATA